MTQHCLKKTSSTAEVASNPTLRLSQLIKHFDTTRQYSTAICAQLTSEDLQAQSMTDASPLKWHLAHTTWAFETFICKPAIKNYTQFNSTFEYLFNSYYNAVGKQYSRAHRGLLTRPSYQEVLNYREHVDRAIHQFFEQLDTANHHLIALFELLINHEQQHQELMFTDLKHLFSFNPLSPQLPVYGEKIESSLTQCQSENLTSISFNEDLYPIGHNNEPFYFDNEGPQHRVFLQAFSIDSQLASNADYLAFIDDGGYQKAEYWLSEAWYQIKQNNTKHPIYWQNNNNQWFEHTLTGKQPININEPVKHVNYFEANAFANWKNKRLPTEQEWEVAARSNAQNLTQMLNQLWQWTSSSYNAYPGFKPVEGAIGEYNGKFMVNQYVLRGGSIATPDKHIRPSYRNFFYPSASWQFSGIRLAESI